MGIQVSLTEAMAKLSQLIAQAEAGEDVIITRAGVPSVRLVHIARQAAQPIILDGLADPNPASGLPLP